MTLMCKAMKYLRELKLLTHRAQQDVHSILHDVELIMFSVAFFVLALYGLLKLMIGHMH